MGGNEKIVGRLAHGRSHAAMRERPADRARDVGVRDELAALKSGDECPCLLLKRRSIEPQRNIEALESFSEIGSELTAYLAQKWIGLPLGRFASACAERAPDERAVVDRNEEIAPEGRGESLAYQHDRGFASVRLQSVR